MGDATSENAGTGIYMDGDNKFRVGGGVGSNRLIIDGTDMEVTTSKFELDANGVEISSTEASISLGTNKEIVLDGKQDIYIKAGDVVTQSLGYDLTGSGTYLSGSGEFLIGESDGGRLKYLDGHFFISSSEFELKIDDKTM